MCMWWRLFQQQGVEMFRCFFVGSTSYSSPSWYRRPQGLAESDCQPLWDSGFRPLHIWTSASENSWTTQGRSQKNCTLSHILVFALQLVQNWANEMCLCWSSTPRERSLPCQSSATWFHHRQFEHDSKLLSSAHQSCSLSECFERERRSYRLPTPTCRIPLAWEFWLHSCKASVWRLQGALNRPGRPAGSPFREWCTRMYMHLSAGWVLSWSSFRRGSCTYFANLSQTKAHCDHCLKILQLTTSHYFLEINEMNCNWTTVVVWKEWSGILISIKWEKLPPLWAVWLSLLNPQISSFFSRFSLTPVNGNRIGVLN